jgi:hypothetical protein
MSATMSGLPTLKSWLDTEVYESTYRPVPLTEYTLVGSRLLKKDESGSGFDINNLPKLSNAASFYK